MFAYHASHSVYANRLQASTFLSSSYQCFSHSLSKVCVWRCVVLCSVHLVNTNIKKRSASNVHRTVKRTNALRMNSCLNAEAKSKRGFMDAQIVLTMRKAKFTKNNEKHTHWRKHHRTQSIQVRCYWDRTWKWRCVGPVNGPARGPRRNSERVHVTCKIWFEKQKILIGGVDCRWCICVW